jgi:co-chaperonin GroES (HSP10)
MKFKPMGDGVLIAPVIPPLETVSPAGIVTKLNTPEPPTKGFVVVTGEGVEYVKKDDEVRFGVHAGRDIVIDEVTYKLINEKHLDGFFLS